MTPDPVRTQSAAGDWWAQTHHAATASCVCGWKFVAVTYGDVRTLRQRAEFHHAECQGIVSIVREVHEALRHAPASEEVRNHA